MKKELAKWLDWPPAWAGGAFCAIFLLSLIPLPLGFGAYGAGLALAALALGLWLMISAVLRMRALQTTINPRGMPKVLVTDSVFAISRNPIYLGDLLLLLAACFWFETFLGLFVAAGFVWVTNTRFIAVEEQRLTERFGDEAAVWFDRVRRWL